MALQLISAAVGRAAELLAGAAVAPGHPSVEEQMVSRAYDGTITPGQTVILPIMVAPFPLRVMSAVGVNFGGALTLDANNRWSLRTRRYRVLTDFNTDFVDTMAATPTGGTFVLDVSKVRGEPFPFFGPVWDDNNRVFGTHDVLALSISATGSPSPLSQLVVTYRIEPL